MVTAQWRVRKRRSLALLSMIATAVTAFTLLTGAAVTSRLDTVGAVEANFRPAYDILVRPKGSVLPLELQRNLVQSGQLAGMRGGITTEQWRQIQDQPGVSVAAPVSMIGYVMRTVPVTVDLAGLVDPEAERQMLRVQPAWRTDSGLSRIPDGARYLYATRNRIDSPRTDVPGSAGRELIPEEVDGDGGRTKVCPGVPFIRDGEQIDPTELRGRTSVTCTGGPGSTDGSGRATAPEVTLVWSIPFLFAAVDPASEAALAGLDQAVSAGRYFQAAEQPGAGRLDQMAYPYATLPVLLADRAQTDATLELDIQRMDPAAVDALRGLRPHNDDRPLRARLDKQTGQSVDQRTIRIDVPYRDLVERMRNPTTAGTTFDGSDGWANTLWLDQFWTVGPVHAVPEGDGRKAETVTYDRKTWGTGDESGTAIAVPMEFADEAVRDDIAAHVNDTREHDVQSGVNMPDVALNAVGTFDPAKVQLGGALSAVPMDTYHQPGAAGADEASRKALGGGRLEPNANVMGLLSQPPLMLTTMEAAQKIFGPNGYRTEPPYPELDLNRAAPISMVRVRLDGAVGIDATSRERVRSIAQQIAERTGLQVDITLGSSPTAVPVRYPAGKFGRPELVLGEPWVKKGVAAVLVQAADRKSVLLSGLVLAVCALAVLNASRAAVRSRRTELGVLACVGWKRRHLVALLAGEMAAIGLAAGLVGTLLAVPLAWLFALTLSWAHLLLTIPAAVLVALVAGGWPAWRAARPDPAAAVRPAVSARATRMRAPRGVTGLALANLARTPGRTLLGAASLLIGVAALTMLLAITFAFRGAATGTLLGEAITLQARTVDYLAVSVTIVLGIVSVADVLYLNIAERAPQLALFTAVGWTDRILNRLITTEALGMGLLGGVLGAALGLAGAALFAGRVTPALLWCAGGALAVGVVIAVLAVIVPIVMLRKLPTAQLLAQE
ncbi:ABC transporter permease [Actinoplanes sp. NEAU-A12]|uniref:ABC transporter permease n=1 Tax=Actinoplanes sandaracinus TaxID=3045177 RepID=A0ABT6WCH0_9ACTN|nr:ABC transporter permease [Actinoplanes sandaracinus]MDI6097444.1 ABC transporter permease [Actinoplanes sandaracinus]